jgi:hypothetical protein
MRETFTGLETRAGSGFAGSKGAGTRGLLGLASVGKRPADSPAPSSAGASAWSKVFRARARLRELVEKALRKQGKTPPR